MIWLILSILCSTVLVFIFRLFPRYKIHTFQAIVINYLVCTIIGLIVQPDFKSIGENTSWIPFAIILGFIFITLFFLIATTAQKAGITIATVAMKLGMVAPVLLGIFFFGESRSALKFVAVILAIMAVVLTSYKTKSERLINNDTSIWTYLLPLIVLIGSGISDSIVQYTEITYFSNGGFESFVIILFGTAAALGSVAVIFQLLQGKLQIQSKNIVAGIILGIPNYGSIYFIFKTLNESALESSVIFPVNNIGIVSTAAIGAVVLFRERLNIINIIGLLCTAATILIISKA